MVLRTFSKSGPNFVKGSGEELSIVLIISLAG
jgi:hypothetical protein